MTLTEFLQARIAEDVARGAALPKTDRLMACLSMGELSVNNVRAIAAHASRALAECDAKLQIVALHHVAQLGFGPDVVGCDNCHGELPETWGPDLLPPGASLWPCETVQLLALPYADHPDFRQEWRP